MQDCPSFITVIIEEENNLTAIANILKQPECGAEDGSVSIEVNGGSGAYSYSWGSGATRDDLAAGSYSVEVKDLETGCVTNAIFTLLNSGSDVNIVITNEPSVSCIGEADGEVTFVVSPDNGINTEIRNGAGDSVH